MLEVGKKAPSFKLPDQNGSIHKLEDYKGKKIVLFFYPKDDTSGCTKEACNFNETFPTFKDVNAVILGVSPDPVKSHKKFAEKYKLNFPLLADVEKEVVERYGVWQEKSMYGRKYMGVVRTTFLINEEGKIKNIFEKVKVDGHDEEVLEALKS